jgi:hypothetical protein
MRMPFKALLNMEILFDTDILPSSKMPKTRRPAASLCEIPYPKWRFRMRGARRSAMVPRAAPLDACDVTRLGRNLTPGHPVMYHRRGNPCPLLSVLSCPCSSTDSLNEMFDK